MGASHSNNSSGVMIEAGIDMHIDTLLIGNGHRHTIEGKAHMTAVHHCTNNTDIPILQGLTPSPALACEPPGLMGVSMLAPVLSMFAKAWLFPLAS